MSACGSRQAGRIELAGGPGILASCTHRGVDIELARLSLERAEYVVGSACCAPAACTQLVLVKTQVLVRLGKYN